MKLKLTVIRYQDEDLAVGDTATFDESGGTIGRAEDSGLLLPDLRVSRLHAEVIVRDGQFVYLDRSRAGTQVISTGASLQAGDAVVLRVGMILQIGDYAVRVEDLDSESCGSAAVAPQGLESAASLPEVPNVANRPKANAEIVAPLARQIPEGLPTEFVAPRTGNNANSPYDNDTILRSMVEPATTAPSSRADTPFPFGPRRDSVPGTNTTTLPQGYSMPLPAPATAVPMSPIAPSAASSGTSVAATESAGRANASNRMEDWMLTRFLEGAGLEPQPWMENHDAAAILQVAGELLLDFTRGLMALVRTRPNLQRQGGIERIGQQAAESDPLRFASTPAEVLNLFLQAGFNPDADMTGIEAHCHVLRARQLATVMLARKSVESACERFDPRIVERLFVGSLVWQRKAKCWDAYSGSYEDLVREAEEFLAAELADLYSSSAPSGKSAE